MKIEVSHGEIVDKHTILQIKKDRIRDEQKLFNINREFDVLSEVLKDIQVDEYTYSSLLEINKKLWDVEDELRVCENIGRFGDHFIELARKVYKLNDERALIKKHINIFTHSYLVEEKSY